MGDRKFCRDCGAQIPRNSVFCEECGAALTQTVAKIAPTRLKSESTHPWYSHRLLIVGVVIVVLVLSGLFIGLSLQPAPTNFHGTYSITTALQTTATANLNQPVAPDFTLPIVGPSGPTGQTFTLSSTKGKVVLLEFMEPWSPHCQNMGPVLNTLHTQYSGGNVVFLTVAGPWNGATASDAANFITTYGTNWLYVYDSSGTIFSEYGVNSAPTFYIIGTDGSVASTLTGEQSMSTLSGAISAAGGT